MRTMTVLSLASLLRSLCASSLDINATTMALLSAHQCPQDPDNRVGELIPLHRLYDEKRQDHLLASDLGYVAEALAQGYEFQKTIGCVPRSAQFAKCPGLHPRHEIYHPRMQTHAYWPKGAGQKGVQYWTGGSVASADYYEVPGHAVFCVKEKGLCGAHKELRQSLYIQPKDYTNADHFYATDPTEILEMKRKGYKYIDWIALPKCHIW